MHNQLRICTSVAAVSPYFARGKLDDCDASVMALGGGGIAIGFGLGSLCLTQEAATELVDHLIAATKAAEVSMGTEGETKRKPEAGLQPRQGQNTLDSTK